MSLITVKPKDGLTVKHPVTGSNIRVGQTIERTPAMIRLINCGDLEIVKPKKVKEAK